MRENNLSEAQQQIGCCAAAADCVGRNTDMKRLRGSFLPGYELASTCATWPNWAGLASWCQAHGGLGLSCELAVVLQELGKGPDGRSWCR